MSILPKFIIASTLLLPIQTVNAACSLDVDNNGQQDALTDGTLILRHQFGFSGEALTQNAVGTNAQRSNANEIRAYLDSASCQGYLDVDGNQSVDALTDGLLIMRYLTGLNGLALIEDVVAANADRQTSAEIMEWLNSPPVFSSTPSTSVAVNTVYTYSIVAADPDVGDTLTISIANLPAWLILTDQGDGSAVLTGTPTNTGTYNISLQVSDQYNEVATQLFSIAVTGNNNGTVSFNEQIIDTNIGEPHAVAAADFNGDGHMDLVATDFVAGKVYWYQGNGANGFLPRQMVDANLAGAYPVSIADVDGDGDVDVLANGYVFGAAGAVVWYENDGAGQFTRHNVDIQLRDNPNGNGNGPHSIIAVDINEDGHKDLLVGHQNWGVLFWYKNDGNNQFTRQFIDQMAWGAKHAVAADLDGDGDIDVTAVSFFMPEGEQVTWYENDGNENFTEHTLASAAKGSYFVSTSDVDGDGDLDILTVISFREGEGPVDGNQVGADDNSIILYRNNGGGNFSKEFIDADAPGARTVIPADVDGDGDDDLIAGIRLANTVAWYRNDGTGQFTKQIVADDVAGAYGVFAADMNADGKLDVLSTNRNANEVSIHYQQ